MPENSTFYNLSLVAPNFAQKQGNTICEVTVTYPFYHSRISGQESNPPALMGGGLAWFALQHGRNRYERSQREHSHSVPVRANHARKPSQPGVFAYFLLLVLLKRGGGPYV